MLTCDAFGVAAPDLATDAGAGDVHLCPAIPRWSRARERPRGRAKGHVRTCFGHPFISAPPEVYGRLLADLIARHGAECWLVNTGWSGASTALASA